MAIRTYLSIIILNVNVINIPIKRHRVDDWIKKDPSMCCLYTMEYYSAIKRNKTELFVVRWMDLQTVIQSEVSQKEKNKYHMLTHIYGI